MKTIHAIYKNGVFQPLDEVELPDDCQVEFEPRPVVSPQQDMSDIYRLLSERYSSGERDVAARHNEHQP
ncbi:MAG: antitoxin family protein [Pirellulaceae bacterium]